MTLKARVKAGRLCHEIVLPFGDDDGIVNPDEATGKICDLKADGRCSS